MKLPLHAVDFDENTITFKVPTDAMARLSFFPEEVEVDLTPFGEQKCTCAATATGVMVRSTCPIHGIPRRA